MPSSSLVEVKVEIGVEVLVEVEVEVGVDFEVEVGVEVVRNLNWPYYLFEIVLEQ